jgi:hypothetical protein
MIIEESKWQIQREEDKKREVFKKHLEKNLGKKCFLC